MIITCEECSTSFNLDEKFLKPSGSKVRCSKCQHVFTAFPVVVPEEKDTPPEDVSGGDAEPEGGSATAPGMVVPPESDPLMETESVGDDAAASEDTALEDLSEDLDLDMDLEPEAGEEAFADIDVEAVSEDTALEDLSEDLDLDLDLDLEPEAGDEVLADVDAEVVSEDTALEDLSEDLDLDLDTGLASEAGDAALADVDAEAVSEDTALEDLSEDLDLDLDTGLASEAGDAALADIDAEAVSDDAVSDELDLSALDEALDMEPEPVEDDAAASEDTTLEDLSEDLDLDLNLEPEVGDQAVAAEVDGEDASDELDMSDIKFEMGTEDDTTDFSEDAELELDLDFEQAPGEGKAAEAADELDLSGFEETLELDSPPGEAIVEDAVGEDVDDLELELEMEDDALPETQPEDVDKTAKDTEEEIEDLDFELDMEFEPDEDLDGAELELETDDTEDLDMSDIEEMLEVKDDGDMPGGEMADLDLGEPGDTEVEKWKVTPGDNDLMEDTAEIDLSDIELDADGVEDEDFEDQELELDLDIDDGAVKPVAEAEAVMSEEPEALDISHFEDVEMAEASSAGVLGEGDIELEFEIEGAETADGDAYTSDGEKTTHHPETISIGKPEDMPDKVVAAAAKKPKQKKTKPVGKSSSGKPVMILLLLLIVAFAAVVVLDRFGMEIPFVTEYIKQVPYVNQLMQQEVKKSGEITTSNISSKFVDNANYGKFFVITGMVKNEYSESRRLIQLTGRLFANGKMLVKEEMIYCGNTLTDIQLAQMEITDINKKMTNRFGDNKSNVDVKPGQQIPFMVVFSQLPQDLEEFTIEITGSFPVQP